MIATRLRFSSILLSGALLASGAAFAQQPNPDPNPNPNPAPPVPEATAVPEAKPDPAPKPEANPTPPPAPAPAPVAPVVPPPPAPKPEPPAPKPEPKPAPPVAKPDPTPEKKPDPVTVEKTVYLPYEDLEKIFEKEGRGVFLPYKEFLELWNQLNLKDKEEAAKPPADGVVKSASYTAKVQGADDQQVMIVEVDLELESFKDDGWASVPLRSVGMNIAEAETGDAKLELLADGGHRALLPKAGVYKLKLKLFEAVVRNNGERSTQLHLPMAPISKFTAEIPEQGWHFDLGEKIAYTTVNQGPNTRLEFFFGQRGVVNLKWRKESEESKLTPLLFADTKVVSKVIPGAMQTTVDLDYRILRAGVDSLKISVPKPHEVLSVDGPNIKEWDVQDGGESQHLLVSLHTAAKENYKLKLTLETGLVSLPIDIDAPAVQAENAVRQSGSVELMAADELEVAITKTDGLTQQATGAAATAGDAGQLHLGAYRFLRAPYGMSLNVKKAAPVVQVASVSTVTIEPDVVNLHAQFNYEVKRVGIFETTITIPDGYTGVDVTGDVIEDFNVSGTTLKVRFKSQLLGPLAFTLGGRALRATEDATLTVPVFEPQSVDRHDAKVGLAIHTSLEPNTDAPGGLRNEELRFLRDQVQLTNATVTPLTLGFSYRGAAEPAQISFRVKDPQVSGEVRTLVDIQEQVIRYHWWIDYEILYAGVDELILKLPASIATDLRPPPSSRFKEIDRNFQPAAAKPDPDAPADAADAQEVVHWAFRLLDKQLGAFRIELTLDVPNSGLEAGTPIDVKVPEISLVNVFRETGQIAVSKGANLELGVETSSGLETIDPRELGGDLVRPGVLKAFKYRRHPISLTLPVSKNDFMKVPTIVVTYADVTSVVSGDAGITTEMVYWIRNNNEPSLKVQLPAGATMESDVYVDGAPQTPMKQAGSDDVFVRLPAGAEARNRSFPVRFVYEIPSAHPGEPIGGQGSVAIPVAQLANADINVLQSRLNLYLPTNYRYTKFEGAMQLPAEARGWRRLRNAIDFLVPALGPQLETGPVSHWQAPPALGNEASSGFDVPMVREGELFRLYRLDKPGEARVSFRSETVGIALEAGAWLLAFLIGALLTKASLRGKFVYFVLFGLGALVVSGLLLTHDARIAQAVFIGVVFAAGIWILAGFWRLIRPRRSPGKVNPEPPAPGPSQGLRGALGGLDPSPDSSEKGDDPQKSERKSSPLVLKQVVTRAKPAEPVKTARVKVDEAEEPKPEPAGDADPEKKKLSLDLPIPKPVKPISKPGEKSDDEK